MPEVADCATDMVRDRITSPFKAGLSKTDWLGERPGWRSYGKEAITCQISLSHRIPLWTKTNSMKTSDPILSSPRRRFMRQSTLPW